MAKNLEPVSGVLNVATYPNRFNVVIPTEAPFFRTGIKITAPGQSIPLIEGLDYYLGYYYDEAAEALKDAIYGGIILLNHTEIEYEIVPVGREYRIPASEIGKWLVNPDIEDPRNVDWSKLMRYAPVIPPIDPPQSMEEAILRDDVVAALNELTLTLKSQAADMEHAYDACTADLIRTGKKIYNDGLYQHHLIPNAHPYTGNALKGSGMEDVHGTGTYLRGNGAWIETYSADELVTLLNGGTVPDGELTPDPATENCLMVAGKAVNATLAFSRTFNQLLDVMSTAGIQQRDVDALMGATLGDLFGRLSVEQNNTLTFKTANDNHIVQINGGSILLKTKLRMEFFGDRDNNEAGIGVEVGAGLNTLMAHSGPEAIAPVYNGVFLITPEQVKQYIHSLILQSANAYFKSSPTLNIVGTGKEVAPVTMTANPPTASDTVEGLFAVSSTPTPAPLPGTALSQLGVTGVRDDLDKYVDDTFTINGKGFDKTTQVMTLVKGDFQLGNVDNTTPAEKPVSTALAAALVLKALSGHTHTLGDLINVPTASGTVAGMMQLHDAVDATTDKAVTARQGYLIDQKIKTSEDKAGVLLPSWAVIGSQYGKPGFLPIPAQGNYEGYIRTGNPFVAMRRDGDMLHMLRNGYTGFPNTEAVYYAYARINADGSVASSTQTSFKYHPIGMTEKYPGVVLKEHRFSDADCGIFLGADGKYYAVLYEGSLDYRKHTKVLRLNDIVFKDLSDQPYVTSMSGEGWNCFVYKDAMYLLANAMGTGVFRMVLMNIPFSAFSSQNADVNFVTLTGARFKQGSWNMFFKDQSYTAAEDPDVMAWATPEGFAKWHTRNLVHGPMAPKMVAVENGKLRVGFQITYYLAGAVTTNWGRNWLTSYLVDLEAKTIVHEDAHRFPMCMDENGLHYKGETANAARGSKMVHYQANNRVNAIYDGEFFYVAACDQTPGTQVVIGVQRAPVSLFDFAKWDQPYSESGAVGGLVFNSGMGSVYRNSMSHPIFLGGEAKNVLLTRANDAAYAIEMEYTTDTTYGVGGYAGFGPSNNRAIVPWTTYEAFSKMTLIKTGANDQEFLDGAFFIGPDTVKTRNVAGTVSIAPDSVTISEAEWNKLKGAVKGYAKTLTGAAYGYVSEYLTAAENAIVAGEPGRVLEALWVMGTSMAGGPLCLFGMATQARRNGYNRADLYMFMVSTTIDAQGNMMFNVPDPKLHAFSNDVANTADNGIQHGVWNGNRRQGQPFLVSANGTDYVVNIPSFFGYNSIGGSANWCWRGNFVRSGNSWAGAGRGTTWSDQPSYSPNRYAYVKHLNGIVQYNFELTTAAISGTLYDYTEWVNSIINDTMHYPKAKVILGAMETAEGWIMYITEEVYLYVKHRQIQVPQYELDLSVAFAGNNANQTFHVHVEGYEVGGVWAGRYQVGLTRLPDTETRLYVGSVTTDDKRIIAMDLRRAKRLGRVRPVLEHAWNPDSHENAEKVAKQFSPLGVVQIAPLDVTASEPSYLSQAKAATLAAPSTGMSRVQTNTGVMDWTSPVNPVEKFWKPAEVVPLTSPAISQEAKDLGMVGVSFGSGKMGPGEYFGLKVKFTNTKGTVRIKSIVDDHLNINIDGTRVKTGGGSYTSVITSDFAVTPGEHTLALEVGEGPGFSPVYTAFILYDFDGTTERELIRSGPHNLVGMIVPILAKHKALTVLKASQSTFDSKHKVVGVTDIAQGYPVPFVVETDGSGNQTVTYATSWYPLGSDTLRTLGTGEGEVNLMIMPSIQP